MDLPHHISWKPLRWALGLMVSTMILILAPFLAFGSLCYEYLWEDLGKGIKTIWTYTLVWAMITGNIWAGVFTRNRWFSEPPQKKT